MNHKIIEKKRLLTPDGTVAESGWSDKLLSEYSPYDITASKLRIKEWDNYTVISGKGYAFSSAIADNRYMGFASATFFDIENGKTYAFSAPRILPMGQMGLSMDSSKGDIYHKSAACEMSYVLEKGGRHIKGKFSKTRLHDDMEFDLFFEQPKTDDTIVTATPWVESNAFRYSQKISSMPATGYVKINGQIFDFTPDECLGTLDWSRGVWQCGSKLYHGSGNGFVDGKRFGFNIGYGFGNTKAASENAFFYDGKCNKLDRLRFEIPKGHILNPWKFISSDGRFNMDFVPLYDSRALLRSGVIVKNAHRIFGRMSGLAVLDNGSELKINNLLVMVEKAEIL